MQQPMIVSTIMSNTTTKVLSEGSFEHGAEILRHGDFIFYVPPFTHWDDEVVRVIDRDGIAVVQIEKRKYSGCRSWSTGIWKDLTNIGPVEGLTVIED